MDESYIFSLIESDNDDIRVIAFEIMQHLSSDKIHNYSISLIKEKKDVSNALSLLCSCYQPEDEALLSDAVKSITVSNSDGAWHGAYMSVEKLLDKRSCRFGPGMFIHMYRQTLCSSCRFRLLKAMYKRKILPVEMLEECLYDSYDDTRKLKIKNN